MTYRAWFAALALLLAGCTTPVTEPLVNDATMGTNPTVVRRVVYPETSLDVQQAVQDALAENLVISVAGGRRATGGQAFVTDGVVIDLSRMHDVVSLDRGNGVLEVEAGATWDDILDHLEGQATEWQQAWMPRQKQYPSDHFTVGGSLAANSHGFTPGAPPLSDDVISFVMVDARGHLRKCSRYENADLFRSALGGYGLFGVITTVRLQLVPWQTLRARWTPLGLDELAGALEQAALRRARYAIAHVHPAPEALPEQDAHLLAYYPTRVKPALEQAVTAEAWLAWRAAAYRDHAEAFALLGQNLEALDGETILGIHALRSPMPSDLAGALSRLLEPGDHRTETWVEVFVPPAALAPLVRRIREDAAYYNVRLLDLMVSLVEPEQVTALPWADQPYAAVIGVLDTPMTESGLERVQWVCERLIDSALELDGSFSLGYHRYARREQLQAAYPSLPGFLENKRRHDPFDSLQSSWYRHVKYLLLRSE